MQVYVHNDNAYKMIKFFKIQSKLIKYGYLIQNSIPIKIIIDISDMLATKVQSIL